VASSLHRIAGASTPRRRSFMAQPFQSPSGIFQLRRKVPLELRAVLGHEYKRTLGTRDPLAAKARFAEEWSRSEEVFSLARAQSNGVDTLNARDMQQLAARWFKDALEKSEATGEFSQWLVPGPSVAYSYGDQEEEHAPLVSLSDALNTRKDSDKRFTHWNFIEIQSDTERKDVERDLRRIHFPKYNRV
jgi:hypothetical protein